MGLITTKTKDNTKPFIMENDELLEEYRENPNNIEEN